MLSSFDPVEMGLDAGDYPPGIRDVVEQIASPQPGTPAWAYLEARGELRQSVVRIISGMAEDSRREVEEAAYYKYLDRLRRGEWPVHGKHLEDWYSAEKNLCETRQERAAA
jgi:hypothetical protein